MNNKTSAQILREWMDTVIKEDVQREGHKLDACDAFEQKHGFKTSFLLNTYNGGIKAKEVIEKMAMVEDTEISGVYTGETVLSGQCQYSNIRAYYNDYYGIFLTTDRKNSENSDFPNEYNTVMVFVANREEANYFTDLLESSYSIDRLPQYPLTVGQKVHYPLGDKNGIIAGFDGKLVCVRWQNGETSFVSPIKLCKKIR